MAREEAECERGQILPGFTFCQGLTPFGGLLPSLKARPPHRLRLFVALRLEHRHFPSGREFLLRLHDSHTPAEEHPSPPPKV